ncbi:MAG: glycosyltransferase family 2 protein [Parcubacteria group bacterium]|nr:glycosyltransferase family 2 protein [Parcubacteria group bacterium]
MKVSITIPAYNAEETIKKAVQSALNQDFPKDAFEVVVVNDGSTDNTLNILQEFGDKIRIINQANQGAVKAANKGFREARNDYIIKLDADDVFELNIIKEMADVLDKNSDIDFVYSDYYEEKQGETEFVSTSDNLFNTIAIGIMFRKQKLARQGFYNETVVFAEYDLLLQTLDIWNGFHIPKPLFRYMRREGSITTKEGVKEFIDELKKAHPDKIKEIDSIRCY